MNVCGHYKRLHIYFTTQELIIPGGRAEIIFNLKNALLWLESIDATTGIVCKGAQLLGQCNRYFFIAQQGEIDLIGIRFRQGGLAPFMDIPLHHFTNQIVPLTTVFSTLADSWLHQLGDSETGKPRLTLLAAILTSHLKTSQQTLQALHLISKVRHCKSDESVQDLCLQTGVYYKKLERIFTHYTGYTPKNFNQIVRFYKALQAMQSTGASLTQTGLTYGYYDQSHFIKDFKAFTGSSPNQFQFQNATIAKFLLESKLV